MARIRTIKPEFWTDDKLTECSLSARLLFIGTWNFADDAGNLDRSAKQIKARVFPVDNIDCEPLIQELITHGLLIEYACDGKNYLHIQGFVKHQVINRPSAPHCPAFDQSLIVHGVLVDHSVSAHAGREGKGKERKKEPPASADGFCFKTEVMNLGVPADLVADWLKVRKAKRAANTKTALDRFKSELDKSGWTAEQAVRRCCERSWVGFEAEWVKGEKQAETKPAAFDRKAYEAKRREERRLAREAYAEQMRRETVPPVGGLQ